MNVIEFLDEFNVLYNNINSNQAPGLDEYQISVFMTKAQDELLKNLFVGESTGNPNKLGMDMTEKRHIDFSNIMRVVYPKAVNSSRYTKLDNRSILYEIPNDILCIINETFYKSLTSHTDEEYKTLEAALNNYIADGIISDSDENTAYGLVNIAGTAINPVEQKYLVSKDYNSLFALPNHWDKDYKFKDGDVIGTFTTSNTPEFNSFLAANKNCTFKNGRVSQCAVTALHYGVYTNMLGAPYKSPMRNQVWRLLGNNNGNTLNNKRIVELVIGSGYYPANISYDLRYKLVDGETVLQSLKSTTGTGSYVLRYIRKPKPIVLFPNFNNAVSLDGNYGYDPTSDLDTLVPCELDSVLHKEIVQRAVELAKQAWGGDDANAAQIRTTMGNRME